MCGCMQIFSICFKRKIQHHVFIVYTKYYKLSRSTCNKHVILERKYNATN